MVSPVQHRGEFDSYARKAIDEMKDLTVIMMTPNLVPKKWAEYHKSKLLESIGDTPLITISRKPMNWGVNLIQTEYSLENIYRQLLRGAKTAKTHWIAVADDDTLYPKQHFAYRPPQKEGYFYNLNRWHLFTWGEPFYFHKPRHGGGLMIASRELVIKALEERFKMGSLPPKAHHELGTRKDMIEYDFVKSRGFYTKEPIVSFYHEKSIDEANRRRRKYAWPVRAYDIPVWGRAEELRKRFL